MKQGKKKYCNQNEEGRTRKIEPSGGKLNGKTKKSFIYILRRRVIINRSVDTARYLYVRCQNDGGMRYGELT